MFSFSNVIHFILIFQGSLLVLYILTSKNQKTRGNIVLAIIIGAMVMQMAGFILSSHHILTTFLRNANGVFGYLYGPLLYLYNKSITRSDFEFDSRNISHFGPAFLVLISAIFGWHKNYQTNIYIGYAIHISIYVVACFLEVSRYRKAVRDNRSDLEQLNVGWLQSVFVVFTCLVFVDVIQFFSFMLNFNTAWAETVVFLMILTAINLLYFKGFVSVHKIRGVNQSELDFSSTVKLEKKIDLTVFENQQLLDSLTNYMRDEQPFKNPNLTIGMLADALGVQKRNLSELVNHYHKQNFVDFINTFRVDYAKERLQKPKDPYETILEVLYEAGFNSKSSFNAAFRKKTGKTPTQFKKNQ